MRLPFGPADPMEPPTDTKTLIRECLLIVVLVGGWIVLLPVLAFLFYSPHEGGPIQLMGLLLRDLFVDRRAATARPPARVDGAAWRRWSPPVSTPPIRRKRTGRPWRRSLSSAFETTGNWPTAPRRRRHVREAEAVMVVFSPRLAGRGGRKRWPQERFRQVFLPHAC